MTELMLMRLFLLGCALSEFASGGIFIAYDNAAWASASFAFGAWILNDAVRVEE